MNIVQTCTMVLTIVLAIKLTSRYSYWTTRVLYGKRRLAKNSYKASTGVGSHLRPPSFNAWICHWYSRAFLATDTVRSGMHCLTVSSVSCINGKRFGS